MTPPLEVRRVPPADELRRDGERLVLVEDRAVRVIGLGPAILDLTEDWIDLYVLLRRLAGVVDVPVEVDGEAVLEDVVAAMAAEGLLERR